MRRLALALAIPLAVLGTPAPWAPPASAHPPAPRVAAAPAPTVRFFAGLGRRSRPLQALTFRAGRPPRGWFATCRPAYGSNAIYDRSTNSIISMALMGEATLQAAGGAATAAGTSRRQDDGPRGITQGRFDGRAADVQAALRRLAPGDYRLTLTFSYTWDEHTDGPTWEGRREVVGQGVLPVRVLPR